MGTLQQCVRGWFLRMFFVDLSKSFIGNLSNDFKGFYVRNLLRLITWTVGIYPEACFRVTPRVCSSRKSNCFRSFSENIFRSIFGKYSKSSFGSSSRRMFILSSFLWGISQEFLPGIPSRELIQELSKKYFGNFLRSSIGTFSIENTPRSSCIKFSRIFYMQLFHDFVHIFFQKCRREFLQEFFDEVLQEFFQYFFCRSCLGNSSRSFLGEFLQEFLWELSSSVFGNIIQYFL